MNEAKPITLEEIAAAAATLQKLVDSEAGQRLLGSCMWVKDSMAVAVTSDVITTLTRMPELVNAYPVGHFGVTKEVTDADLDAYLAEMYPSE